MARNAARPLSPHLTIWRWGPHMLVSILHRVCGNALAFGAAILFTWWLAAAASGPSAYATWYYYAVRGDHGLNLANILARLVAIGLTWSFFQHASSGVRHFVLDTGAGYELKTNRTGSVATIVVAAALTLVFWGVIVARGGM